MRPMDIEACRGLVAMCGRAPRAHPLPDIRQRWGEHAEHAQNQHPLQQWVDALPPFQREHVRTTYGAAYAPSTQEEWDEAWAQAIFKALWY